MNDKPALINATPTALHTNYQPIHNIGTIVVLATFGLFLVWAFVAPLDSSAVATGVVVVKSHKKIVQHLDGGIVSKITVKDGDLVNSGDTLIVLDDTQMKAQLEVAKAQQIKFSAQVARLEAERDHLKKIQFPEVLNDIKDIRVVEAKNAETNVFSARKNAYDGEIALLNQRIEQLAANSNGLQLQVKSKQLLVNSLDEEIKDLKALLAEGFADKQRLRDVERSHSQNNVEIAQLNTQLATTHLQINETRIQILQIQKKFQEDVVKSLSDIQANLNDAQERVIATQDKLNRIVITAPNAGMVQGLAFHTENGVIPPGHPILEIVPQDAELIVDAQVSPMDIDRVTVGLKAEIRFSAFKQATTPKMDGIVTKLSTDRLLDEKTNMPYYKAAVELTPESFKQLGKLQLVAGMPAEVLINTGERTLFEYLAQPATNAFARSMTED